MIIKSIDTVEFGLDVEEYNYSIIPLIEKLHFLKEKAQETGREQPLEVGNIVLMVQRTGVPFYAYKAICKDFSICFMETHKGNNPPVFVRFMSSFLWSYGIEKSFQIFYEWFNSLGLTIFADKLSRIDVCLDTDEAIFKETDINGVSTRSRHKEKHFVNDEFKLGRQFSGFTFGRGEVVGRIYNKSLEIKSSGKVWFRDIWNEHDYNSIQDVWRVEFQLRRKMLREFGIDSVSDFFRKEEGIWAYLTQEWLTIRIPSKDSNEARWRIKPKWKRVQKASFNYLPSPLIREKIKVGNEKQLLDQASGLILSLAAISDHETIDKTLGRLKMWFELNLANKNTTFDTEKNLRKKRFLSNAESGGIVNEVE